jgi:predicted nuclease of predicted toxin-antitoxin system
VNFIIDAQLPPALARWLTSQGQVATHVFDLGFNAADDSLIWQYALTNKAVIITKDEDFADRWLMSERLVPLVWLRKGNCSTRVLLQWLQPLWAEVLRRLEQGEQVIELRG